MNANIENNADNQNKTNENNNEKSNIRNNIIPLSQITENIYLGNIYDAQNIQKLLKLGIQKVLSLISESQLINYPPEIEHKLIKIPDFPRQNIIQYFGECILFLDDNKKTLVHCEVGKSRSATIVIAYIMWKNQLDFKEASKILEQIRPCIYPNYGFVRQLNIFEKLLKRNKYNINTINFREIRYPRFFEECCF